MSPRSRFAALLVIAGLAWSARALRAESSDIPARGYGLSIGNSTVFYGLRVNCSDRSGSEPVR